MIIEDITINQYIKAWYKENYSEISKEDAQKAYCEYMDISGLYKSKSFEQVSYINYLSIRIAKISTAVSVQKMFLENFFEPYADGFFIFEEYGYKISWDGDTEKTLKQILFVEKREYKKKVELKQKKFLFEKEQNEEIGKRKSLQESRIEFIRNITILGKNGYQINRNLTTMEEYGLMIFETLEQTKKEDASELNRHRNRHSKA